MPAGASRLRHGLAAACAAGLLVLGGLAAPSVRAAQVDDVPSRTVDETPGAVAEATEAPAVLRVFEIRYRPVSEVSLLVAPMLSPDALFEMNARLRTVTVRDRPDIVRQVEDFVRRFDVPPHAAVVRIVVEKASRLDESTGDAAFAETAGWSFERLADTTLEVLERGHAEQSFGTDESLEIRVVLDSVDVERHLLHFEEFRLARAGVPEAGVPPRELLSTALELEDRVGKVVMAASSETASEALVVRVVGLIRERKPEAER